MHGNGWKAFEKSITDYSKVHRKGKFKEIYEGFKSIAFNLHLNGREWKKERERFNHFRSIVLEFQWNFALL